MLSKEEIKNIKELKDMLDYASMCVHSNLQLDNESSKLLYSYIEQLETNKQKLIEYIEKKMNEYDETIIELVLQNVLAVAKGEKE